MGVCALVVYINDGNFTDLFPLFIWEHSSVTRMKEICGRVGSPAKVLANIGLATIFKLGKSVYNILKPSNDPTSPYKTAKVFVPFDLYDSVLKKFFADSADRSFRLNNARVHRFCSKATLANVVDLDLCTASWGDKTTTIVVTPEYPFNIKYIRESELLQAIFVGICKRSDGTLVISNTQKLRKSS